MKPVPITLTEASGIARTGEPFTIGIPFAQGELRHINNLTLTQEDAGELPPELPLQAQITATWPDGSIKWALLDFRSDVPGARAKQLLLQAGIEREATAGPQIKVTREDDHILVDTGPAQFGIDTETLRPFRHVAVNGSTLVAAGGASLELRDDKGGGYTPRIASIGNGKHCGQLRHTLTATGFFESTGGDRLAAFSASLTFYAGSASVTWEFTITNNRAAAHPGGLWDLGSEGSIYFSDISARLRLAGARSAQWQAEAGAEWQRDPNRDGCIYQDSSGGENWKSNNHKNRLGEIPLRFRGYHFAVDRQQQHGLRASPFFHMQNSGGGVTAHLKDFWQNFPKGFSAQDDVMVFSFFPQQFADVFELQGGEQKTHTLYLAFSGDKTALQWARRPATAVLPREVYARSGVVPSLLPEQVPHGIDAILDEGLQGERSFFVKREIIDEYGWRNFGDVFADHETLHQQAGETPLISHYNNQYDPTYGFAQQFFNSGDTRWFELMDDLARHVVDIDLYHTDQDRAEYNGGMFWHTDHYLDAHTCTHRTFSKHNDTSSTPGQTGGGPGAEHCYTTGLMYHYYITGNERSRASVLQLAAWMAHQYEDRKNLLAQIWSVKKHEITKLKKLLKGEKPLPYTYPLTRGTGNYIVTLLDAYELTRDRHYLEKTETVIRATLHPGDDIASRNLENIEVSWSYVVLLLSLVKYLAVKEEIAERDDAYAYARDSLLAYTEWMLANERTYMSDPDILEFPNKTWDAQEIRKANLFLYASLLDREKSDRYLQRAREFMDHTIRELAQEETRHFSRIQIILLQNYGLQSLLSGGGAPQQGSDSVEVHHGMPATVTLYSLFSSSLIKLFVGLRHFSPKRELAWLKARTNT